MTTKEVAKQLVELCNKGENMKAVQTLYARNIVSVEPVAMPPMPAETRGIESVIAKTRAWMEAHEVHSGKAIGPFVAHKQFIVEFDYDITIKKTGQRLQMREAGLYTVHDGKVVREDFFFIEK
jgi:ketosteroid isomerase-like protein